MAGRRSLFVRAGIRRLLLVGWGLAAARAPALAPPDVLVLANRRSALSREIAHRYLELRRIPRENLVYLDLPEKTSAPAAEITPDEARRHILDPVRKTLAERGLDGRILVWTFSADFPIRVTGDPPLSLPGWLFFGGRTPDAALVREGRAPSPLFRGPAQPGGPQGPALSLDRFHADMGTNYPLVATHLAYTGARGLTRAEALRVLDLSAAAEGMGNPGAVHWALSEDVRSRCRAWQYPAAAAELTPLRLAATISSNFPTAATPVWGLLQGAAWTKPQEIRRFAPGAFAEHLTSFGALFHNSDQTKITAWLRAGACATAGTVAEPYALWTKFPHARFFAHYAGGASFAEALAQAVASPVQLMPIGDPLMAPRAPRFALTLVSDGDDPAAPQRTFFVRLFPELPADKIEFQYALDGHSKTNLTGPMPTLDTAALADGYHELLAVARTPGAIRFAAAARQGFIVRRNGRSVVFAGLPPRGTHPAERPLRLRWQAEGAPTAVGVLVNRHPAQRLEVADAAAEGEWVWDAPAWGPGPVEIQAAAWYADGGIVCGPPHRLLLTPSNHPPVLAPVSAQKPDGDRIEYRATATDAENDPVVFSWFVPAPPAAADAAPAFPGARLERMAGGGWALLPHASNRYDVALFAEPVTGDEYDVELGFAPGLSGDPPGQTAAFVFAARDAENFRFAGLDGETCAWTVGECRNGTLRALGQYGAPLRAENVHRFTLRRGADGATELWSDGACRLTVPGGEGSSWDGRVGLLAQRRPARLLRAAVRVGTGPVWTGPAAARPTVRAADAWSWSETTAP